MDVREASASYLLPAEDSATQRDLVRTDEGLAPGDWRVMPFLEAVALYMDFRGRTPRKLGMSWGEGEALALSANNVQMGRIDESKEAYRGSNDLYRKWMTRGDCELGDVLLTTEAPLGNVAQIPDARKYILSQRVLLVRPQPWIVKNFFAHYLRATSFQTQLQRNASGSTAKGIQRARLDQLPIVLPSWSAEQQAIAEALSDADALIESLSLLLAKKHQIKQGAMQELLTATKRMPGHFGTWVSKPVAEIADCLDSLRVPLNDSARVTMKGEYPYCGANGILDYTDRYCIDDTVVLIAEDGGYFDEYLSRPIAYRMSGKFWVNNHAHVLREKPDFDNDFLFYALVHKNVLAYLASGTRAKLNRGELDKIGVFAPLDQIEQRAIAQVLADIDAEMAAIEARLVKARDVKQAMMQVLLTGRIRLVQPASNVIPLPIKPTTAHLPPPQPAHNWQINEAVVIGVLSQRFGSEKCPLPRKRRVKLMYLLHRHAEGHAEGYLKKAAGPYDPNTRYKGPEAIALKNGYVRALRNATYEGFVAGDKAEQAQRYFEQWYGAAALDWLERFHYRKTDDLELLATVDMAMVDMAAAGQQVDVTGVKRVIAAHPEWVPKLSRELFSDANIARAIAECTTLFTA